MLENLAVQTPSTHRQQLSSATEPAPRIGLPGLHLNSVSGTPVPRRSPSGRVPLTNLNSNGSVMPGFSGYGMSAGLKVSNPPTTAIDGFANPVLRSRGMSKDSYSFQFLMSSQLHNGRSLDFRPIQCRHLDHLLQATYSPIDLAPTKLLALLYTFYLRH